MKYQSVFQFRNNLVLLVLFISLSVFAQNPGDTIKIQAFDYNSSIRDTLIEFPEGNLSYEKIIMKYNMRCKKGLVSTGADRNKGCGEWDYSCNTFIVDSSKVELVNSTHPNYIINGSTDLVSTGDMIDFTTLPIYDYYQYDQSEVVINEVLNEESIVLGSGSTPNMKCLDGSQVSGKSQFLYLSSEMTSSGMTAGMIDGIELFVENQGGRVNFLSINVKHFDNDELDNGNPEMTGFENVYFNNYQFENGSNKIYFSEAFDWDGTQNLLFEISYTNSETQNNISLLSANADNKRTMYTNNNYAIDFSQNGYIDIDPSNFSSIKKELTVSFWTYGDEDIMPVNTSIIWANAENKSNRDLNIHLPWSNGQVYFDCGFDGGYDRLSKIASPWSYKGRWTHWAFTKDVNAGTMKMFINGDKFTQSTGKNNDIEFLEMILGADYRHLLNYKGKINEFRVWDVALDGDEIKKWINKPIDPSHPFYNHLVAYYPLQEGSDLLVHDLKNNSTSNGTNILWNHERGNELSRGFQYSLSRPQIGLLQGEYDKTVNSIVVIDSVRRTASTINAYSITSKQGTVQDDLIDIDSTFYLYKADPSILYDGESNDIIETYPIGTEITLNIEELEYIRRYPFYNEIMSFVTPYGIGLDFGLDGKTWLFDVTDFAPILQGEKGLKMTMGGQYQEEMDLEFWFIVGTPPRDILNFDQLWQGSNRLGSVNILDLYEDIKIKAVDVDINPNGEFFKIRSTITGHGSEGEFEQNGGSVFHSMYINEEEELFWLIDTECSENPVYPQGGTWVIDRQGWCPGERSVLNEFDITEFVEAGTMTSFDYAISKAQKPSGDYRFLMAHQLITYGGANHTIDAAVKEVLIPSNNVLYSRLNPVCVNPSVVIQNTGSEQLISLDIEYWINNNMEKENYHWSGSLDFMESETVSLPAGNLYVDANPINNNFHINIQNPNETTDGYPHNNIYNSPFVQAESMPDEFIIEVKTNSRSFENSYKILDNNGVVVKSNNLQSANTKYRDTIRLNGCYKFELRDSGGDGLEWWANPSQGKGYVKFKTISGTTMKTLNPDFGGKLNFGFSTKSISYVEETQDWDNDILLSPNPTTGIINLEGKNMISMDVSLYDIIGNKIAIPSIQEEELIQFDLTELASGIYLVTLKDGQKIMTKKVIVE